MKLLAIDTATEQCSVALLHGTDCLEKCVPTPRGHTDLVLPMIQSLIAETGITLNQLDAIAFGRGPGAFTGVRIAIGVAQGLGYALGLPLLPISDLAAIAQQAANRLSVGEQVLVCMDARMSEIYTAVFALGTEGVVFPVGDEQVMPPVQLQLDQINPRIGLGMGFRAYPVIHDVCRGMEIDDTALPRAQEVAYLAAYDYQAGLGVAPNQVSPVYLRDQVVHVKPQTPAVSNIL